MDTAINTNNDTPVIADGIEYWTAQPATYDGVLGMYMLLKNYTHPIDLNRRWIRHWGDCIIPPYRML